MSHLRLPAVLVLLLALALLAGLMVARPGSGQAHSAPALVTPPHLPPTPTAAAPPVAALATLPFTALRFDTPAALAALRFEPAAAHWHIDGTTLRQAGFGPAHEYRLSDTYALLDAELPADLTLQLSAYNERAAVADLLLRAGPTGFYRYRVLADSYAAPAHRIERIQHGVATLLVESDAPGLQQYHWHQLSFEVSGSTLLARFDGQEVLRAHDHRLVDGQAGFGSMAIGGLRIGSLEVLP